jgi:hypothetical protein
VVADDVGRRTQSGCVWFEECTVEKLRAAIEAILAEDLDMIGEPVSTIEDLIDAFNALDGVEPIAL